MTEKENTALFWDRVKSLCKERKITHIELCKNCEIDLGKFKGQLANCVAPKVFDAYKIANFFGVPVEYFVTGDISTKEASIFNDKYEQLKQSMLDVIQKA